VWWESDSEGREVWEGADRDVDGFLDYTRQTEWTTEGRTETAEQCSDGDRERYVFTFDASGNPLGVTCDYESDGVIDREEVWTRDAEGVLLWYESREAGVVHTRADYGYADGLLVTEHWVHGWGTSDIAYTYDAERRLIEYVRDGDSSTEHILYFYDADGWLSRADYVYPDSAGELQVSHTERYEYDSEGRPLAWELDWYLDGSAVEWMYWTYETVPC
jgi:YD repeat-containing protein